MTFIGKIPHPLGQLPGGELQVQVSKEWAGEQKIKTQSREFLEAENLLLGYSSSSV